MKNIIIGIILFFNLPVQLNAQEYFWVSFTDKNNSPYSISNPEEYLSERAIERRIRQRIAIDSLDLPVNIEYINEVLKIGAEYVHDSKWLNGVTVKATIDSFEIRVLKLPFVKEVQLTKTTETKSAINKFEETSDFDPVPIDTSYYGLSVYQTSTLNGQFLHNQNFRGQGIHIAVLDGGFLNANIYSAMDSLWEITKFLGTKDFVDPGGNIFETHYHGMSVFSCMGGNAPGTLIGTATKASYWMITFGRC